MSRTLHHYTAYGLRIHSTIALPFVPSPSAPDHEPDVVIRIGAVPAVLPKPVGKYGIWESAPGAFLINVDGVARYLVTEGRTILIEPYSSDHDVSVFLTGSVFAALLQQRGVVTLHASAIETRLGAALFLGSSGSGKSSLLSAMLQRGYVMLADDVTGVILDPGGRPTALSSFPSTRLWADALDELGLWHRTRGKVRKDIEKYLTPVERFRIPPLAVHAVYILTSHNRSGIEIETGTFREAFKCLMRYTYRKRHLRVLGQRPAHFRTVSAMVKQVPVVQVKRPLYPFQLNALADEIEQSLRERDRRECEAKTVSSAAGASG